MRVFPRRLTDEESVAKTARDIRLWHRFRGWFIAFHAVALAAYGSVFWLVTRIVWELNEQADLEAANGPLVAGVSLGLLIGMGFGFSVASNLAHLGLCFRGFRAERLLCEHYPPPMGVGGQRSRRHSSGRAGH